MAEQQPGEDNPSGYCYPAQHDHQHISKPSSNLMTANHQIQASCNFEAPDTADDQVYDLTAGVDMIGFRHHKTTAAAAAAAGSATTPTNPPMMYKGFFQHKQPILQLPTTTSSSSSQAINQASTTTTSTTDHFYQQGQGLNVRGADDDCSTRALRCVFPCEGNERPSQGLSLSLNSNNPSSIGLQSFELRRPTSATYHPSSRSRHHHHHQQGGSTSEVTHQDFRLISPPPPWNTGGGGGAAVGAEYDHAGGQPFLALSYSKYFRAAQELLNEFCKLGSNDTDAATDDDRQSQRQGHNTKNKPWGHEKFNDHGNNYINASSGGGGASTREQQLQCALYGLDLLELQKRKRRLLVMLEELERRYRHYSNEMESIVSSFEAVAGDGSANLYTCLASKAMSRHFRSLKDGIVGQIKAVNKAVGEKDPPSSSAAAPAGTTKGETPRLRILDQTLRQQRAFQQMTMIETHPWRPQRGLPERSVSLLRAWLFEHFLHPYPSDVDKHILARQTGLTRSQVSNWFINARVRLWKPMVEEMYLEETKEEQEKFMASSSDHHSQLLVTTNNNNNNINNNNDNGGCNNHDILNDHHANYGLRQPTQQQHDDEKPNVDALIRFGRDSECISSIIANNIPADKNINKSIKIPPLHASNGLLHQQQQRQEVPLGRVVEAFGPIDIDFASYNDNAQHQGHHQSFGAAPSTSFAAGGVSLTLGLQQNGGNNNGGRPVSLAFSDHHAATAPPHDEHSLYYPTGGDDRMEPAAVHEYSLFDGDNGGQNLPYRNLMGAQMLHDFA